MRQLSVCGAKQVSGSGWLKFIFPVVIGFVVGGPVGAGIAAGTVLATTGVSNLECLQKNKQVPTLDNIVNGC